MPETADDVNNPLEAMNESLNEEANTTEFSEEDEVSSIDQLRPAHFNQAVLWGTDWTVETLIAQMRRGNLEISPQFQRRDAWPRPAKSRFIESLILGLPIPQIVLAEKKDSRGSFVILDGKQRLLSIMQYAGLAENSEHNNFGLSGLEVKTNLSRKKYAHLENDSQYASDLNSFLTHTVRAVVIRNWPSIGFLHLVFHRLNSGSLKLSAQELRQALLPGPFTAFADDFAVNSPTIYGLLNRSTPDSRMRDTELLVRYIAFRNFLQDYNGRMKDFLDWVCNRLNTQWAERANQITQQANEFVEVINALSDVLGSDRIARRRNSSLFNRSIFDPLSYYLSQPGVVLAARNAGPQFVTAYEQAIDNDEFDDAVESDTAGIPHTGTRYRILGEALNGVLGDAVQIPIEVDRGDGTRRLNP